jgi:hypothetical protein
MNQSTTVIQILTVGRKQPETVKCVYKANFMLLQADYTGILMHYITG